MPQEFGRRLRSWQTRSLGLGLVAMLALGMASPRAWSQAILPPAETTFLDANGDPLASGTACFYVPTTLTAKVTYQDQGLSVPNTSPCVTLDSAGRALIWGSGTFRQIVKDINGTTQWDQITSGGGGSSGDSFLVGAPDTTGSAPNYLLAFTNFPASPVQGQPISFRASFTGTGSETLNVNSGGAKGLYKPTAAGPAVLAAGDIHSGQVVFGEWDPNLAAGAGGWQVLGGLTAASGGTGTVTSVADGTNGGLLVTNPTTAVVLSLLPSNLLTKASPSPSDSVFLMDSGAGNAAKTALVSAISALTTSSLKGVQFFTASGTYVASAGTSKQLVFVQGPGGSGGAGGGLTADGGTGGTGGGACVKYLSSVSTPVTVTINSTNTVFGAVCTASVGTATSGDLNLVGQAGGKGSGIRLVDDGMGGLTRSTIVGGQGGSGGLWGGGAAGGDDASGTSATGCGGGGGGGANAGGGGAGASGCVMVMEF